MGRVGRRNLLIWNDIGSDFIILFARRLRKKKDFQFAAFKSRLVVPMAPVLWDVRAMQRKSPLHESSKPSKSLTP